jgi:protein MpaA
MVSFVHSPNLQDARALLEPLFMLAGCKRELTAEVIGKFSRGTRNDELARFHFSGPDAGHDPIRLGLFAGVHGDEPAGCTALVQFLTATGHRL